MYAHEPCPKKNPPPTTTAPRRVPKNQRKIQGARGSAKRPPRLTHPVGRRRSGCRWGGGRTWGPRHATKPKRTDFIATHKLVIFYRSRGARTAKRKLHYKNGLLSALIKTNFDTLFIVGAHGGGEWSAPSVTGMNDARVARARGQIYLYMLGGFTRSRNIYKRPPN